MNWPAPIRKQLKVAAYSSPAISALTVTPVFILGDVAFSEYPWAFGLATLLVFLMWCVNIGIYARLNRGGRGDTGSRRRYLWSYAFCILLTLFLFHDLFGYFHSYYSGSHRGLHFHLIIFFAVDTVLLILQDLVVTREKNAAIELENSRLRMRDMEALNLRLMQQVQPHFLFNSLSTLKALIGVAPEQAGEYLVRLSGFLRSSMTGEGASTAKVGKELELCADYLEMQKIRFGDAIRYSIEVPDEVRAAAFVPVFSVQLLVENAIKHNVLTRDRPLAIGIVYHSGVIVVSNNLQRKPAAEGSGKPAAEGSGMGLINLRERYKAISGDPIVIDETADRYAVSIKVLTDESRDH